MIEKAITVVETKMIYVDETTNIGITADGAVYVYIGTEAVLMDDYIETLDKMVTEYINHGEPIAEDVPIGVDTTI